MSGKEKKNYENVLPTFEEIRICDGQKKKYEKVLPSIPDANVFYNSFGDLKFEDVRKYLDSKHILNLMGSGLAMLHALTDWRNCDRTERDLLINELCYSTDNTQQSSQHKKSLPPYSEPRETSVKYDSFGELTPQDVLSYLKLETLVMESGTALFRALVDWRNRDRKQRGNYFNEVCHGTGSSSRCKNNNSCTLCKAVQFQPQHVLHIHRKKDFPLLDVLTCGDSGIAVLTCKRCNEQLVVESAGQSFEEKFEEIKKLIDNKDNKIKKHKIMAHITNYKPGIWKLEDNYTVTFVERYTTMNGWEEKIEAKIIDKNGSVCP